MRAICAALFIVLVCAGCKEQKIFTIRLTSTNVNVLYYSRGRIAFEPTGDTAFKRTRSGSWADGAVTYSVNDSGIFEIIMDGQWMQDEAMRNRMGDFPGAYVIEIPLAGLEDAGTFQVTAEYAYEDTDTGWRIVASDSRTLTLPFDAGEYGENVFGLILQCVDPMGEACHTTHPEPDTVETPDAPDLPDIPVEPDATTDPDVVDTAAEPDPTDIPAEPDVLPDTSDVPPDTPEDTASEPPDDVPPA